MGHRSYALAGAGSPAAAGRGQAPRYPAGCRASAARAGPHPPGGPAAQPAPRPNALAGGGRRRVPGASAVRLPAAEQAVLRRPLAAGPQQRSPVVAQRAAALLRGYDSRMPARPPLPGVPR